MQPPPEIWPHEQYGIRSGEGNTQTSLGFGDTNGLPNIGQMIRPSDSQQWKKKKKKKEKEKKREPAGRLQSKIKET